MGQLVLLCFFLAGCSYQVLHFPDKNTSSSSSNHAQVSSVPSSGYYRVRSGDTLFSIAFRYGLDYRELAKANNIDASYVIYPNQKIRLIEAQKASTSQSRSTSKTSSKKAKVTPKPVASVSRQKSKKAATKTSTPVTKDIKWSWPVDGEVKRGFSNAGVSSKGIDIKAQKGDLVKAAADGVVVYAGSGLIGYGNLVIVKHDDVYLSAYAYNERIIVKEKQSVRAGDSLAVIGGKGTDRPLLHFEVRRDGQPIDPLDVLPKN
ncbi:peptidoglycan DD-metalloendopeptidase family protein [Marinomonas posidonica]|uniref:Peptidase M23 n=1 Tax=Marinomonas posidonica (strain CECT 7376 / NCIMB 14433 / IVIA-Po-181) TaxID=491952 RepID=F6CXZ7_MARPP|nr:peptidoglycan DD-metalloendopeptidase family protein [Marinomonas posidonica]AEF55629.1 Peptidase M23 [Marinomonas posidonica IVIA-Po-181]